jgi:2-isopropylmalate synthase
VLGAEKLATLKMASRFVAETVNLTLDTHAPYVGDSAFAHKGGLHASAIARMPESYEHVHPELVGNLTRVVMSELAGRASMVSKAKALGFDLSDNPGLAAEVLAEVKERENAGYSYEAADASLSLLIRERVGGSVSHFALESFRVIADKREDCKVVTEATVKVLVNDERFIATAEGDGPVSALDHALRQVITSAYPGVEKIELTDYKVRILNERSGTDATTRVLIESGDGEGSWGTVGVSTNIIEASWDALLASIEYGLLRQEV